MNEIIISIPLEVPSWNTVMRMNHKAQNKLKDVWKDAGAIALRLSAIESDSLIPITSVSSLRSTRSKVQEDFSKMTTQELLARSSFARRKRSKRGRR